MSDLTEPEADLIRDIIERSETRTAMHDMERALGWIVVTVCKTFGHTQTYGLFNQPAAAMEYAAATDRFLHEELPEDCAGWTVKVYPLLPP